MNKNFVLLFEYYKVSGYFLLTVETKNCNAMIHGRKVLINLLGIMLEDKKILEKLLLLEEMIL